jgi:hypothetical protein
MSGYEEDIQSYKPSEEQPKLQFEQNSDKLTDLQSEQNSDKLTDQQSLEIQTVQRMLENLKVSPDTMKMFEILKKYKHGKIKLQELYFGASTGMYRNPTFVEKAIKRFYDEELTAEEKLTLKDEPKLDQTNLALNDEPTLDKPKLSVLKNTLKPYFTEDGVLDKDCRWSNALFTKKTTDSCCVHVGKKIDQLFNDLTEFLKLQGYNLKYITLARIAPSLVGHYRVAAKDTSIFEYVLKCLVDKNLKLEQHESFKPQIQFLETFFGFEKTFFPSTKSSDYNKTPLETSKHDFSDFKKNVLTAGRTHSRRKHRVSKKSRKSHRRHRRSTRNKKCNTKRHIKRHTKRYRHHK